MPLISFIIPSYNTPETLLKECLQSVIDVSMGDDEKEIIIVDDGSEIPVEEMMLRKDSGMSEILKDITIIRQENKGLGAARNTGMDAAKGEFLQFVDADDYLIASEEEKVIDQLRKGDADMVMFHINNRKRCGRKNTQGIISGAEYMHHNNLRAAAWAYAFRPSHIRFPENILHEDELFTTLLTINTKRLILIDALPYFYRYNPDSIVTRKNGEWIRKRLNDTFEIIKRIQIHANSSTKEYDKEALQRKVNQLCMDYLYNTITLTHSLKALKESIKRLTHQLLYPLPLRLYTWKYMLFAIITHIIHCK